MSTSSINTENITISNNLTFPNRITINNMPTGVANQYLQTDISGNPVYGNCVPTPGTNEQSLWTNSAGATV